MIRTIIFNFPAVKNKCFCYVCIYIYISKIQIEKLLVLIRSLWDEITLSSFGRYESYFQRVVCIYSEIFIPYERVFITNPTRDRNIFGSIHLGYINQRGSSLETPKPTDKSLKHEPTVSVISTLYVYPYLFFDNIQISKLWWKIGKLKIFNV